MAISGSSSFKEWQPHFFSIPIFKTRHALLLPHDRESPHAPSPTTKHFTILVHHDPQIDISELDKISRSADYEGIKLQNRRSGTKLDFILKSARFNLSITSS